jgi:hypothetical protein
MDGRGGRPEALLELLGEEEILQEVVRNGYMYS